MKGRPHEFCGTSGTSLVESGSWAYPVGDDGCVLGQHTYESNMHVGHFEAG